MRLRLLAVLVIASCSKPADAPPAPAPVAAAPAAPDAARPAEPVVAKPPPAPAAPAAPVARPGGPSVADCERTAKHLKTLVVDGPVGTTAEERQYVAGLIEQNHEAVVRYCLEVAAAKEIACVLAAKQADALAGCERLRRDVPEALATARELTEADCARLFDRLRQFKLGAGVTPEEIDKDREQIIRICQENGKPGTVACFIASPTYEQARRCP